MERTLDIMMEELRLVEEEKKPLSEAINVLNTKISKLNREIEAYKLNNGLYHPMSELINYIGRKIDTITLVERNKDGTLDTDYLYCDEIFKVNEYGQLYFSSYDRGIIEYDNDAHKYVWMYYGFPHYHDYVGFTEIEFDD